MKYAVNYVTPEVMELVAPSDTYIKYPGGKWDLDTLKQLVNDGHKVVLHGLIPSSGSILDPNLCDHIEEFAKLIKQTNQQWLSFHLDHKAKYVKEDYDTTIRNNIDKIREYCGQDMPILIENMPPVDTIEEWCADPVMISKVCKKYNLGLLLDIPHAVISAKHRNEDAKKYIDSLPLDRVKEIHISGWSELSDGKLYDSHVECATESYDILDYSLEKTPNCEMISLEYAPSRDYDGHQVAKEYRENRVANDFYVEQQRQLKKVKDIVRCREEER